MLPTRKAEALLFYLAVEGEMQPRAHLAQLLWPDLEAGRGRSNLRRTLVMLRQALSEQSDERELKYLLITPDALGVRQDPAWLSLDLHTVALAYQEHQRERSSPLRTSTPFSEKTLLRLEQALAQVRGPFLADFTVSGAPAFEEWVREQSQIWQVRVQALFDVLSQHYTTRHAWERQRPLLMQWLSFDPLCEEAVLRLMQCEAAQGERVRALEAFEHYRRRLRTELHAQPGATLSALALQVRRGAAPSSIGSSGSRPSHGSAQSQMSRERPSPAEFLAHGPLVGRAAELGTFLERYVLAARHRPQAVVLHGEAGIGKSRLARECSWWAQGQGAEVLVGQAQEGAGSLPYHLLISLMRPRLEAENAPDDLVADVWLAELARLLPELRERYPDLVVPPADSALGQAHLFEAISRLLLAWARRAPLVLLVEDLHWADTGSLEALSYVAQTLGEQGVCILFLCTIRSDEGEHSQRLTSWLNHLERGLPVTTLSLHGLDEAEMRRFVHWANGSDDGLQRGGRDDGDDEATRAEQMVALTHVLYARTQGHPFYLMETLLTLTEQGQIQVREQAPGRWHLQMDALLALTEQGMPLPVPRRVQTLVTTRWQRLHAWTHALLMAAAVLEREASFEELCQVGGLAVQDGMDALEEGVQAGMLRERSRAPHHTRYTFAHDLLRLSVWTQIGEARRRMLHSKAFSVLQARHASASELSHHAQEAGLVEQAFRYCVQAGDEAMAVFALTDAQMHYQQACLLVERGLVVPATDVERLYVHLSRALEAQERWEEAKAVLLGFLTMAQRLQNSSLVVCAHIRLATVAIHTNDFSHVYTQLEEALVLSEEMDDVQAQVEVLWSIAHFYTLYDNGDVRRSIPYSERAVALAQKCNKPTLLASCLATLGVAYLWTGRFAQAISTATQGHQVLHHLLRQGVVEPLSSFSLAGMALVPTVSYAALDAVCLITLVTGQVNDGQAITGRPMAEVVLASAYTNRDTMSVADITANLNNAYLEMGDYEQAKKMTVDAIQQERLTAHLPLFLLWVTLGYANLRLGYWQEAEKALHQADEIALCSFSKWRCLTVPWQCALAVLQEQWEHAEVLALLAREVRRAVGTPLVLQDFVRWYETEALLRSGHADLARTDIEEFTHLIGENRRHRIVLLRMQAVLAQYDGETKHALEYLHEARQLAEDIGLPGELWQIQAALGEVYEARGDYEHAHDASTHAASIVRELADRIGDEALRTSFLAVPQAQRVLSRSLQ